MRHSIIHVLFSLILLNALWIGPAVAEDPPQNGGQLEIVPGAPNTGSGKTLPTRPLPEGLIKNPIALSIDDVTLAESAGNMIFTARLSEAGTAPVSFTYSVVPESAQDGSDYTAISGALTIPAGSVSAELEVPILDDRFHEADETFVVELSNVKNAVLKKARGIGTILDDDELPVLSIGDAGAEEKTQKMSFRVTLSSQSADDVSVAFATEDGTASAGSDYTAKNGTLIIPAGQTSAAIEIAITMDEATKEGDETFFVLLSNPTNAELEKDRGAGTIQNTHVSFVGLRRMVGLSVPEPSTYALFLIGLLGLGALARHRKG